MKLRNDVEWWEFITWRKQILVWGYKTGWLYLARCNWSGEVEYLHFPFRSEGVGHIRAIAHELHDTIHVQVFCAAERGEFSVAPAEGFGDGFKLDVNPAWMDGSIKRFCWLNAQGTDLLVQMNFNFQRLQFNASAKLTAGPQKLTLPFSGFTTTPVECWNGCLFRLENRKVKGIDPATGEILPDLDFEADWCCHSGGMFVFAREDKMVGYTDMNRETKSLHRLDGAGGHILDMRFIDKEHVVVLEREVASTYRITREQQVCLGRTRFGAGACLMLPSGNGEKFAVLFPGYAILFFDIPRLSKLP